MERVTEGIGGRLSSGIMMLAERLRRFRFHEDQVYLALALLIGGLVGVVVVAFILLSEHIGARMYPLEGGAWRRLAIPIAGSLVTGYLLVRFFPAARGSGIPQTKVAMLLEGGYISGRTVIGRFICSSAALASGIALGREGPSVQIGGGIASVLGRRIGLGRGRVRDLIPVGAAAAVSAAFNTPIAGVLFALEEVVGDLHARVLGSAVIASGTAWVVLHSLLGDEPLFHVPEYQLTHPVEFFIYALLGIAGGLCSVVFVKLTLYMRGKFQGLPSHTRWAQPAVGGLTVGVLAVWTPQVLGVGYDYVGQVLNGEITLAFVVSLLAMKLVATSACYASGNSGGIFGPSLFLGAMLGAAVGSTAHFLLPTFTASPGAYALVGMGAVFAGIIRTPLTSVFMIFELTRDYSIVVPLMIANLVSFTISRKLQAVTVYDALALQDGIHLPRPARERHSGTTISEVMEPNVCVLKPDTVVGDIPSDAPGFVILIADGEAAAFERDELLRMIRESDPTQPVAMLLDMEASYPHVHQDQMLEDALERLEDAELEAIAVLDRSDVRRVTGMVTLTDVRAAFSAGVRRDNTSK
ncbi:MAG: chloride channel protein [Anaerolineae bacterium]|nr:chloride channel protein [Gemmatimonadaceae bacterium]